MGVIFQKQLMPLIDAILSSTSGLDVQKSKDIVYGHELYTNNGAISIRQSEQFQNKYFIPHEVEQFGAGNLGMFANDFAFDVEIDPENYASASTQDNILQLVWRMELVDGQLHPTWPVVILKCDCEFRNHEPMEVGLQYSWRYWQAVLDEQES